MGTETGTGIVRERELQDFGLSYRSLYDINDKIFIPFPVGVSVNSLSMHLHTPQGAYTIYFSFFTQQFLG